MREAVARAYREVTGQEPRFIFSGWGAILADSERAVVEGDDQVLISQDAVERYEGTADL